MISIDPGVHHFAYARWNDDSKLIKAAFVPVKSLTDVAYQINYLIDIDGCVLQTRRAQVVCELPQVYVRSKSKGDPNDLINLALTVGAIGASVSTKERFYLYRPREWKGNIPKEIHHPRILKACPEAKQYLPKNKKHAADILDAVGIGLYHLSRTNADRT